ncbi:zinc ribbon domain-containing protein, partial [Candidatus Bathyarchaeota archaeon]|nr:zinc ribbon domain-containing protein [Candidatus Bathyarchaeota archaeon]
AKATIEERRAPSEPQPAPVYAPAPTGGNKFCPNCGQSASGPGKFCNHCGQKLE